MARATHRVKDRAGSIVGFLVDGTFYTDYYIRENIELMDNLTTDKNGRICPGEKLGEVCYRDYILNRKYEEINSRNPFVRDIQAQLTGWKKKAEHKVFRLEGARQIGKTTELLKFAYQNYEYIIYVNLTSDTGNFADTVQNGCSPIEMEKYCRRAKLPHFVNDENTVLIIDEIQQSPEVYNAIRTLDNNLMCDIIVTGSYLGRILGNRDFFLPAGTVSTCSMFPLSFKEFCRVFDAETKLEQIDLYGEAQDEDYRQLLELYQLYLKTGGYPEVVKKYVETGSISECYTIIDKLLGTFKEESRNYFSSPREVEIFEVVYREAMKVMCSEKKGSGKNIIETVASLARANTDLLVNKNEIANAIVWLKYTGMIGMCSLAENGDMRNIIPDRRMYYMDCGVASYIGNKYVMKQSDLTGLLAETFVYNELHRLFRAPFDERKVKEDEVCFGLYQSYELDFMLADKNNMIYGIEVKSADGTPVSLRVFVDKKFVDKGIVAKQTKGGRGERYDTIPIFTVGCRFPYC